MVSSVAYLGPAALTTVLYAVGVEPAGNQSPLHAEPGVRGRIVMNAVLLIGGDQILGVFGDAYPAQAGATLRIVALGVFPAIVREHYVASCRIPVGRRVPLRCSQRPDIELAMAAAGARIHPASRAEPRLDNCARHPGCILVGLAGCSDGRHWTDVIQPRRTYGSRSSIVRSRASYGNMSTTILHEDTLLPEGRGNDCR